jgi:hypothetical protein
MVISLAFLAVMLGATRSPAFAEALAQCNVAPGSVVSLVGTPHLFINEGTSVNLHWGGDTRALSGRDIQWGNTCSVGLDPLEQMFRGDPWLSAGLPQVGEVIYQAKWEQEWASPKLLRIRTIDDVELFGIGDNNYGNFVLERYTWEGRYGFQVGNLEVGPLASADSFAWSSTDQANYTQLLTNMMGVESAALFQATQAGIDAGTSLPAIAVCEEQGLVQWDQTRNASTALTATQECINQLAAGPVPFPPPPPPPPLVGPPSPPVNLRVSATAESALRLDWTDTANNEQGFRILRGNQVIATVGPNVTTFTDPAWNPAALVCYGVVAFNSVGAAPSLEACPGTPGNAPLPPTNLRLSPGPNNTMQLTWTDTSNNEDGFRIQRANQPIATVGPNVTTYADPAWNPAVLNCYQVIAFNGFGVAPSAEVCPGTASNAPTAPTNLRATAGAGNVITLTWTDTSNIEDGFRIERGNQTIATVGANVTTYTDPGWTPVAFNCYHVTAFNSAGVGRSGEVCPALPSTPGGTPAPVQPIAPTPPIAPVQPIVTPVPVQPIVTPVPVQPIAPVPPVVQPIAPIDPVGPDFPEPAPLPIQPDFPEPAPLPAPPQGPDFPAPAPLPVPQPIQPDFPAPAPMPVPPQGPDFPAPAPLPAPQPIQPDFPAPVPQPVQPDFPGEPDDPDFPGAPDGPSPTPFRFTPTD